MATRLKATGRSPHGERGLKSSRKPQRSEPSGRSPHGERGLKYQDHRTAAGKPGRSPHGERGLKCGHGRGRLPAHRVALLTESVD